MKTQNVTYEQCLEIASKCENFRENKTVVNGTLVSVFNYVLSLPELFKTPFEGAQFSAYELRGITFVHEVTGTKRYLMLHKFFNVNETEGYQLSDIKNDPIVTIQDKLDGSMIRFVPVGGKIFAKTKNGWNNSQVEMAQKIYESDLDLQEFVKETLNEGLAAIFELVSPLNRIVINYNKTELRLLQLRVEETGVYLNIYENSLVKKWNVKVTSEMPLFNLDELVAKQETDENVEGWILSLQSGKKVKFKTKFYFDRHRLVSDIASENTLVDLIYSEKIDDALSLLDKDNEMRKYAERMQIFLTHLLIKNLNDLKLIVSDYSGDRKAFALKYKENPLFSLSTLFIGKEFNEEEVIKKIKERSIFNTRKLGLAREFLKSNGFESEAPKFSEDN